MMLNENGQNLVRLTAEVVSAYVQNNSLDSTHVIKLIEIVHAAFNELANGSQDIVEPQKPAVPVDRSVTPEYIICLEDGKKFKILKRHLTTLYGMSPAEYRKKWGLPADYPMIAPNYAKSRSEYATEKYKSRFFGNQTIG